MKRPAPAEDDDSGTDTPPAQSSQHRAETRGNAKRWLRMGKAETLGDKIDDLDDLFADDETSSDNDTKEPFPDNLRETFKDTLPKQIVDAQDQQLASQEETFQHELTKIVQKHATWPKPGIEIEAALGLQAVVEHLILRTLQTAEHIRARDGSPVLKAHHFKDAKDALARQARRDGAAQAAEKRAAKRQKPLDA